MADDNDNFSNVSWSQHDEPSGSRPYSSDGDGKPTISAGSEVASGAGGHVMGEELLDCTVGSPMKENDGTKDAFISYQITVHVRNYLRQTEMTSH